MLSHYSEAQVYTPSATPSTIIATLPPNNPAIKPGPYPTVNCDMIETPRAGKYKAIVWDDKDNLILPPPLQCTGASSKTYIYVEDGIGNSNFVTIPAGVPTDPDVAWADDMNNPGVDYFLFVVVWNNPYAGGMPCGPSRANLYVYHVTPGMNMTLLSGGIISNAASSMPHIDMWADPSNLINGNPALTEYVVTWSEAGKIKTGSDDVQSAAMGTMPAPWPAGFCPSQGTNCEGFAPDVAAYVDMNNFDRMFTLTYTSNPGAPVPELYAVECNQSMNGITQPPVVNIEQQLYINNNIHFTAFPRIESMGHYDGTYSKWQIISNVEWYNGIPPFFYEPRIGTFNELNPTLTLLDHLSQTIDHYSAVGVAAGLGNNYNQSMIGNRSYMTGYHAWQETNIYSHEIEASSGVNITPNDGSLVNDSIMNYPWDVPRNYGVSSTTNTGNGLLSAWYDGYFIRYKVTGNASVPYQYRPTAVATIEGQLAKAVYPNPAKDRIYINASEDAVYKITSLSGAVVAEGSYQSKGIDVQKLPVGMYIVHIQEKQEVHTEKFLKQ